MHRALVLAEQAAALNEVPVGAVVVQDGQVIGEGHNMPIRNSDPTAHAEMIALRSACGRLRNYRLADAALYVTLEPCPMCVGAMIHARISRLVFAAYDPKTGAAGSAFDLIQDTRHNHIIRVAGGVMAHEAVAMMQKFFAERRA